jgi:RNA polymerase-interacting CarD/CdnL/TRCF family regulator
MNVDEAMAIVDNYRGWLSNKRVEMTSSEIVAITLAAEVERLRGELAAARNQSRNDADAITEQALRVLDSAEVDGDSDSVPPTVPELVELMADAAVMAREERNLWHSAAQRLKTELAAAKAELDELVNETIKRNGWGAE